MLGVLFFTRSKRMNDFLLLMKMARLTTEHPIHCVLTIVLREWIRWRLYYFQNVKYYRNYFYEEFLK